MLYNSYDDYYPTFTEDNKMLIRLKMLEKIPPLYPQDQLKEYKEKLATVDTWHHGGTQYHSNRSFKVSMMKTGCIVTRTAHHIN